MQNQPKQPRFRHGHRWVLALLAVAVLLTIGFCSTSVSVEAGEFNRVDHMRVDATMPPKPK